MSRVTDAGYHRGREPPNKGKRYPPEVLTPDEVRALLARCSTTSSTGLRNRALITVLYRTGLRISEALALYPKDIDAAVGSIVVLRVHPHDLRHTHAFELMMEGVPMRIIQQQLGHTSLATTDRYLAHIAPRGHRGDARSTVGSIAVVC